MRFGLELVENASSTQKATFVGLIIGMVVLGSYLLMIEPKNHRLQELRENLHKLDQQIRIMEHREQQFVELLSRGSLEKVQWQTNEKVLANEAEFEALLNQVSSEANKLGVTITLWKPGDPRQTPSRRFQEIPVRVGLRGGYHEVARLLEGISRLPKLLQVGDLRMNDPQVHEQHTVLRASFVLTGYVLSELVYDTEVVDKKNAQQL